MCVKDEASSKINQTLEDFVQSFSGQQDDSQRQVVAPGFIKDYVDTAISLTNSVNGWEMEVAGISAPQHFFDCYYASIVNPPDSHLAWFSFVMNA